MTTETETSPRDRYDPKRLERIARAIDPQTWTDIDKMEGIGRRAPFLRLKSEDSLDAAGRVLDELVMMGLEALAEQIRENAKGQAECPSE